MYKATFDDLRAAGLAARKHLKENSLRHVVYAYTTKEDPDTLCVMDWDVHGFETDAEFEFWYHDIKTSADMIYAVHAM